MMMEKGDASASSSSTSSTTISVSTVYGDGHIVDVSVNEINATVVYQVKLDFGMLFVGNPHASRLRVIPEQHTKRECDDPITNDNNMMMELNVAYEALESMRKLNLEIQCNETGVAFDDTTCSHCLLDHKKQQVQQQRLFNSKAQKGIPCVICASLCCKVHSCAKFRKEGNTVCDECKHLYSLDYVLDVLIAESEKERSELLTRMFDTYDRTLLMLKYASSFMEDISDQLDKNKSWKNKVGIGSSSVGMVSGSLGIAATACLLSTPAAAVVAPGLIIASIFFGGTSSVMQTGAEFNIMNSEPNRLASRIIAWYGMQMSIQRTVTLLRDANCMLLAQEELKLLQSPILTTTDTNNATISKSLDTAAATSIATNINQQGKNKAMLKTNMFITRGGANTVSMSSNAVSASGNAVSATAMTAAQFASFAGGALSAAVLVCEGYQMTKSILEIGQRCPKADLVRKIQHELIFSVIPDTLHLELECKTYFTGVTTASCISSMDEAYDIVSSILQYETTNEDEVDSSSSKIIPQLEEKDDASTILSDDGSSSIRSFFSFTKTTKLPPKSLSSASLTSLCSSSTYDPAGNSNYYYNRNYNKEENCDSLENSQHSSTHLQSEFIVPKKSKAWNFWSVRS